MYLVDLGSECEPNFSMCVQFRLFAQSCCFYCDFTDCALPLWLPHFGVGWR